MDEAVGAEAAKREHTEAQLREVVAQRERQLETTNEALAVARGENERLGDSLRSAEATAAEMRSKVEDTEEAMRAMKEQLHLSLVGLVDFRPVGRLISV